MPQRLEQLENWLRARCGLVQFSIAPASGDASFRRYFRVRVPGEVSRIAMDAPPDREDCRPFVDIGSRLAGAGLHVPAVYAADLEQGFLLLEDLGDRQYLPRLGEGSEQRLYGDALAALMAMQACVSPEGLPPYDRGLLMMEMELFRHWLCGRHLGLALSEGEEHMLDETFELLVANALEQPRVFVHRDYHSRNLMITHPPTPGILDFQDAVAGPVTYDLVSLLKDAYIHWPLQQVDEWAWGFFQLAVQSAVLRDSDEARFQRWFDLMGVQRHVKVAGIFARLYRRDAKVEYLKDIPLVLDYIRDMVPRYAELEGLGRLISERVAPALKVAA